MQALRRNLKYTTVIPTLFSLGLIVTGSVIYVANAAADDANVNRAAVARSSADGVQVAACNPCAVKKNPCNPCGAKANPCAAKANPCNPCAAKANPCNPCAASNPCNPCAAKGGKYSTNCVVPRLNVAANPCNPCAAANPCAAKANPCNPCAAKANPCNPCAAKNPCAASNPCNPCNPCSAAEAPELSVKEAVAAYDCLKGELTAGYAKSGVAEMANYTQWENVATSPYVAGTHGNRYVNNYINDIGLKEYKKYEEIGTMPVGSVVAKDSFSVDGTGHLSAGPMFLMEKMANGFAPKSGNWRYSMVMSDGTVFGRTKGKNSAGVAFCEECHAAVADDQDFLMLLPEENRK